MGHERSLAKSLPAVLIACGLSIVSGCSLAISGPAPDRPRNQVPTCDTGKGAVGMDVLMTSLLGLGSLAAFADGEEGAGAAFGLTGGLFLASALRGNNAANDCRAAFDEYNVAYNNAVRQQQVVVQQQEPQPQPARPRLFKPRKPPPKQPEPAIEPPPAADPPVEDPPEEVAPPYASPRPPAVKPAPEPPKKPTKPARPPVDDDWGSFWKEAR